MTLALALVVACAGGLTPLDLLADVGQNHVLHWWAIALIAIATELMVFHVEFRREMYSFTFSEIALVLGLFLAAPRELLIGRLVGEAIFLIAIDRQPLRKVALNLAAFMSEVTVLVAVHQLFGRPLDITRPSSWIVAFAAVATADLVGYVIIYQAIRWHGAPITLGSILSIGALTIPVNTSFALVVAILATDLPWATLLLSGVAAFLLMAYRSYTTLSQRYESLSMLYEFTRLVSGAKRPDSVLEAILTQAKDLLRAERAEIWLTDENDFRMRLAVDDGGRASSALEPEYGDAMHRWLTSVEGAAIVTALTLRPGEAEMIRALNAHNTIIAPITESGSVVGLVAVVNRLGEITQFKEADRTMFATLASHASVALENGRLIDRLHHEASERRHESLHDALTGLPNRVLFGTRLREELTRTGLEHSRLAVAVMDLDGFKEINDTLGHQSGDVVLEEVARRISYASRGSAFVARLGGDEFALLLPSIATTAELDAIARRIRAEVSKPIHIEGLRMNVEISIGFSLSPDDASDGATLLQRADVAMYSAKAGHGNGVAFYEAVTDGNTPRRLALGSDLRSAISDGQLRVVFQPKVRLRDGAMIGAEALVRWRHPTLGQIMPDEFVPLAEKTGAINEMTERVLRDALTQTRTWRTAGHRWNVSVNVAMRNLLDNDFVAIVDRSLRAAGIEPGSLTLEITETSVMSDAAKTIDVLEALAGLGVTLSIDDFGTGYSSLSYLQQLPVSEVKIDKMFVSRMLVDAGAEAIVRSVLDLARNLNLVTVAEGVEDRETLERLRRLGCDVAQGYFLSKPIPGEELERWHQQLPTLLVADVGRVNAFGRLVSAS